MKEEERKGKGKLAARDGDVHFVCLFVFLAWEVWCWWWRCAFDGSHMPRVAEGSSMVAHGAQHDPTQCRPFGGEQ